MDASASSTTGPLPTEPSQPSKLPSPSSTTGEQSNITAREPSASPLGVERSTSSPGGDQWGEEGDEESGLEYDEMGMDLAATEAADLEADEELAREEQEHPFHRSGAITPDGLIDEDFEEELGCPEDEDSNDPEQPYRDIAKFGIVQLAGDDPYGRKVIVFSSCRLPPREELDHQRLLKYLKHTLDQYVENDYTLVYFHFGLNSRNKPSFGWLRQAYNEFDRYG